MMSSQDIKVVGPDEGEWLSFNGIPVRILLGSADTGGRTCFNTGLLVPGGAAPPHRHGFAEAFYLLEGEVDFQVGNARLTLVAGDFIHIPPGVPHQPVNRSAAAARLLTICLPGGFDGFQREVGEAAPGPHGPFAPSTPAAAARMRELCPKYGIEFALEPAAFEATAGYHPARSGDGERIAVTGDLYRFLATTADTGGAYAIWHATVPPGGGPPPHRHSREMEVFFILNGEMTFFDDGKPLRLAAGGLISLPEGSRHWFRNESEGSAEMLIFIAPAGLERMFRETGVASPDGVTHPPDEAEKARLAAAASRYGIELG
jgi:quercetin dioxygenase-like cupin family protein